MEVILFLLMPIFLGFIYSILIFSLIGLIIYIFHQRKCNLFIFITSLLKINLESALYYCKPKLLFFTFIIGILLANDKYSYSFRALPLVIYFILTIGIAYLNGSIYETISNLISSIYFDEHIKSIKSFLYSKYSNTPIYSSTIFKCFGDIQMDLNERYKYLTSLADQLLMYRKQLITFYKTYYPDMVFDDIESKNAIDIIDAISHDFKTIMKQLSLPVVWYRENYFYYFNANLSKVLQTLTFDIDSYIENYNSFMREFNSFIENLKEEIKKETSIIVSGVHGEEYIQKSIELFKNDLNPVYNSRIVEDFSVENDVLLFSEKGIYSLEIKNFGNNRSYSIEITPDGQWLRVDSKNNRTPMKDVMLQVNNHIALTQKFINKKYKEKFGKNINVKIKPMIVIANDNVLIDNKSENLIVRASQIYTIIDKQPIMYDKQFLRECRTIIEENSLPSIKYTAPDYLKQIRGLYNCINSQVDGINTLNIIMKDYYKYLLDNNIVSKSERNILIEQI